MGYPSQEIKDRMEANGWVPTREAAKRAMVSRETIHDWVSNNRLHAVEYAGHRWISVKSLDEVTAPLREVP